MLALRSRHAGRRAFILGNAPLVAEMELSRLRSEITFAVDLDRIILIGVEMNSSASPPQPTGRLPDLFIPEAS
jgi:hypothetical protein